MQNYWINLRKLRDKVKSMMVFLSIIPPIGLLQIILRTDCYNKIG
jgi:hypothetical protein